MSSPTQLSPVYREVDRTAETSSYSYVTSNDIQKQLWFHGAIPRNDAESLIRKDGEFLVRESASSQGQYVLTGMRDGLHRHLLLVDPQGKVWHHYLFAVLMLFLIFYNICMNNV